MQQWKTSNRAQRMCRTCLYRNPLQNNNLGIGRIAAQAAWPGARLGILRYFGS